MLYLVKQGGNFIMMDASDTLKDFENTLKMKTPDERVEYLKSLGFDVTKTNNEDIVKYQSLIDLQEELFEKRENLQKEIQEINSRIKNIDCEIEKLYQKAETEN